MSKRKFYICGMSVLLASLVVPGGFRIALNRAPFSGDESQYARASVELFRKLRSSPSEWPHLLMTISPYKPSALVWIGQFFVPLGSSVGSIDWGLLLCTLCIQTLTLALLAVALWEISAQRLGQSMLIVLISASAPLFVAQGSYFLVEPVQTLVAAWFIFVMARARVWPPAFTLGLLFLGSMCAPLTKQTTPLFCIWPGLVALLCALHRARTRHYWGWQTRAVNIALIAGVLQATATSMWYWTNWRNNIAYVTTFTRGPIAAIWGKEDTFLGTLSYWVGTFPSTLILPVVVPVALGLVVSAIFHRAVTGRDEAGSYFTVCAFAALLQVVTVLIVFSFSANRELRYVLPLLPSVSLVLCWSVAHFGKRWVTGLAVIAFAGQLGLVWGYTFGVFSPDVHIVVRRIDRDSQNARLLTTIVERTCHDTTLLPSINILAIDPAFRGDWLTAEPANYVATRDARRNANGPACVYLYPGGGFFGDRADTAWDDLVSQNVRYIITIDPRIYGIPSKSYNRVLDEKHFPLFWSKLDGSPLFRAQAALPEDPGLRIFRRVD